MTKEREREAFEEWFEAEFGFIPTSAHGCYGDEMIDGKYEAWQAARATDTALIREMLATIATMESKIAEARGWLTMKPCDKPKCNIVLLQLQQGKFSNEAIRKAEERLGASNEN